MIAAWIVGIGFGAIILAVGVLVYIGWRGYDPDADTRHTRDCMALYRLGLMDDQCVAPHGTDWFVTPRAQIELETALDGQLSMGEKK